MVKFFLDLERKLPWGFLGVVLALLFGLTGVYIGVFYSKKADIVFEISPPVPVISVTEDITGLDVYFNGKSIRKEHKNLYFLGVKLFNKGNGPTRPGDFDVKDLPQLVVSNIDIVSVDIIGTSDQYLDKVLRQAPAEDGKIFCPPIILDEGGYVSYRLLALFDEGKMPEYTVNGKIANSGSVSIQQINNQNKGSSMFKSAFAGGVVEQVIRLFAYGFGFILSIVVLIVVLALVVAIIPSKDTTDLLDEYTKLLHSLQGNDPRLYEIAKKLMAYFEDMKGPLTYLAGFVPRLQTVSLDVDASTADEAVEKYTNFLKHIPCENDLNYLKEDSGRVLQLLRLYKLFVMLRAEDKAPPT